MRWKRSKTGPNFGGGRKEGSGCNGGTGRDPGRGRVWVGASGLLVPWGSALDSRAVPSPLPTVVFPPDPALTSQGLDQDQDPREQLEEGSRPHDSHPLGLGRSSVWAGRWRLYNRDPLIGFSRNRAPSGSENWSRIMRVQAAGLNTSCERFSETRGEGIPNMERSSPRHRP